MQQNPGEVSKDHDGFKVRFERIFPHPIQKVWDAITNPEKLKIWFTEIEMDFTPGGKMTIYFQDEDHTQSFGKIIQIDPPNLFQFSWEEELATWELSAQGDTHCKLIFTYSKLPVEYATNVPAGWHIVLQHLEAVLEGHTTPFPFDGKETEETKYFKAFYHDIVSKDFPEIHTKSS